MATVTMAVAGLVSLTWSAASRWLGPRLGFVDRPGGDDLKVHSRAAVPLGGVGIFAALGLTALLTGEPGLPVVAVAASVVALGLVDDRWGLSPRLRLAVELVAGAATAWVLGFGPGAGALVALGIVVGINAVNLFDGLDGLVASVSAVTLAAMAVLATARSVSSLPMLALLAALVGFGVFNWHPARVFLGDNGSYLLGMVLVVLGAQLGEGRPVGVVAGGSLLGVFLVDLVATVLRRHRAGVPLFEGDRSHLYDRMRDRGVSVPAVALTAAAAQAVLCGLVVAVWWVSGAAAAALLGPALVVALVVVGLRWG